MEKAPDLRSTMFGLNALNGLEAGSMTKTDTRNGRAVTIKDVAREAGVSLGTASRVLNGKSSAIRISEETAERVLQAATRLNYRKNLFASGLRGEVSQVVGIIVRDLDDPFMRGFLRVFQDEAHKRNIDVLIGNAEYSSATAKRQIRFMAQHWFTGLVMLGNLPESEELRDALAGGRTPCIAVDCDDPRFGHSVGVDDESGARLALAHLIGLGHRRLMFVGDTSLAGVDLRAKAFKAFADAGKIDPASLVLSVSNRDNSDLSEVRDRLVAPDRPTAVFCGSDRLALRILAMCKEIGLSVPGQVSVVGFDDIPESGESSPPLTTIRQPMAEMARAALDGLLAHGEDGAAEADSATLFAPPLVVRESSAPLASK